MFVTRSIYRHRRYVFIPRAELVAARIWFGNWRLMLPSLSLNRSLTVLNDRVVCLLEDCVVIRHGNVVDSVQCDAAVGAEPGFTASAT